MYIYIYSADKRWSVSRLYILLLCLLSRWDAVPPFAFQWNMLLVYYFASVYDDETNENKREKITATTQIN